jgi:hypothetical protein
MEATHTDAPQFHPRTIPSSRVRFRNWLRWIFVAVCLWMVFPAHTSVWWHLRHGNRLVWQNTRFQLPISWSVSWLPVYTPGGTILERKPWLPFTPSPYFNTLYLDPAATAGKRDSAFARARNLFHLPWGPVSESSRRISARTFHCLSQPAPMRLFSYGQIANVHAYCEEQASGWQLSYWGNPKVLDEALQFLGAGEVLMPGQIQENPAQGKHPEPIPLPDSPTPSSVLTPRADAETGKRPR